MAAKHLKREELEKDEVAETITTLVEDFNRHRTAILATIGVVVLLIAIYVTVNRRSNAAAVENAQILTEAHQNLGAALTAQDAEERKTKLQAAIDGLQPLIDKRGSSPAGLHALYLQGNAHYLMEDFAPAAELYEKFVKAASGEDKARGQIALGQTFESQSYTENDPAKLAAALEQYVAAASGVAADSYLHFQALMNQGRVLELQGNDSDAVAIYRRVIERGAPREAIPGAEEEITEKKIETGNAFIDSLLQDAVEGASELSFAAEAQQRIDRIESAANLKQVTSPETPGAS